MTDPIGRLTQATHKIAADASKDLQDLADKQEGLLDQKKTLRDAEKQLEAATGTGAATTAEGFSTAIQNPKTIQAGIAESKDSFESKKDSPVFSADPTKGQLTFGDGIEGKTLPSGESNIKTSYRTGEGQSGNTTAAERPNYFSRKSLTAGDLAKEQEYLRDKRKLESSTESKPELVSKWAQFVSTEASEGGAVDPNALVQYVLRESYIQTTEDLKFYAEKVKYFNQLKKEVREYLNELRTDDAVLKLDTLTPGKDAKVIEELSSALRESVQGTSEDKQHYVDLLQKMNKISLEISSQFESISDAGHRPHKKEKDDDD